MLSSRQAEALFQVTATAAQDGCACAAAPGSAPAPAAAQPRGRLLLVEDEFFIALATEATLQDAGFEVLGQAASAEEAVRLAHLTKPEIVLMDVRLAGPSDGIAAATEILRGLGTYSLFITAHSDSATRSRGAAAEPLGWLTKPHASAELISAVEEAVAEARRRGATQRG